MWPLAQSKVYLKLFLPESLKGKLGSLGSLDSVDLNWEPGQLLSLLDHRLILGQITVPQVNKSEQWLVNSARRSPRALIENGGRLLTYHIEYWKDKPLLVEDDFIQVLGGENRP